MFTHDDGHAPSPVVEGPSKFKLIETEGDIFDDAPDGAVLIHAVNCLGQWGSGIAKAFKTKYPAAFEVYKAHCDESPKSTSRSDLLPGTCLLIPPQVDDYVTPSAPKPEDDEKSGARKRRKVTAARVPSKKHWIACLFTSYGYGKRTKAKPGKDPPSTILENTGRALRELRAQLLILDSSSSRLDASTERFDEDTGRRGGAVGGEDAEGSRIGGAGNEAADKGRHTAREAGRVADLPGPLYACKFNSGSFGVEWKDTREVIERVFEGSMVRVMYVVSPPAAAGK